MIKKIKKIFKGYMVRPLIYKTIMKCSVVLVIVLLWDRFVNTSKTMSVIEDAFFIVGMIFVLFSWFQYLRLDGFSIHHLLEEKKKTPKKKHAKKDIVDFVDEKIVSFSELEEDERVVVVLLSNLISGLIFVVISIVALVL